MQAFIAPPAKTSHVLYTSFSLVINHPSLKSLLDSLPVDHIPNRTKVLRLPVLILQIIRMLPSINTQQRRVLSYNGVLVRIGADLDLAGLVVLNQPGPAAALDAGERGVKFGLEVGEGAVGGFDCCLFGFFSSILSKYLGKDFESEI